VSDIITVEEVAALLRKSKRSVYGLTRKRSRRVEENPSPSTSLVALWVSWLRMRALIVRLSYHADQGLH